MIMYTTKTSLPHFWEKFYNQVRNKLELKPETAPDVKTLPFVPRALIKNIRWWICSKNPSMDLLKADVVNIYPFALCA